MKHGRSLQGSNVLIFEYISFNVDIHDLTGIVIGDTPLETMVCVNKSIQFESPNESVDPKLD